jgi:hypothetical protein
LAVRFTHRIYTNGARQSTTMPDDRLACTT